MSDYDLDYFKSSPRERSAASSSRGSRTSQNRTSSKSSNGAASRHSKPSKSQNRAAQRQAPQRSKKPNNKKKTFLKVIIAVAVVAAIAVTTGVVMINIDRENRKNGPFHFSENVKISGIDIGGLSYNDGEKKLRENSLSAVKNIKINIEANGYKTTLDKEDFSYSFDYTKALDEAKIYSLKEQGIYEAKEGETEPETQETTVNPSFTLDYQVEEDSIIKQTNKLASKVDKAPQNARVSKFTPFGSQRFKYKSGIEGYKLDRLDMQEQLSDFFEINGKKGDILGQVEVIRPEITVEDLKNNIVGLATATSYSYNTPNGNINMSTALKACNGSVIEPGNVWSFNKCTGDSNLEKNGYKKADVINNKKIEQGVGGGICQASTTIFKAALFANMAVVERYNHFWASSYAYAGEDATIDYPNLDLKLKNPTDYQMFIECRMVDRTLTVNIYGYQEPTYDNVKLVSENYEINKDKNYKSSLTRILYLNGKIVKEEVVCKSTYSLKDNHSVRPEDKGTYRVMVDGTTQQETDPATEPKTEPTTKPTPEPKPTQPKTEPAAPKPTEAITDPPTHSPAASEPDEIGATEQA